MLNLCGFICSQNKKEASSYVNIAGIMAWKEQFYIESITCTVTDPKE